MDVVALLGAHLQDVAKPPVVSSPSVAPVRSIMALVASVVPCTTCPTSASATPTSVNSSTRPFSAPIDGRARGQAFMQMQAAVRAIDQDEIREGAADVETKSVSIACRHNISLLSDSYHILLTYFIRKRCAWHGVQDPVTHAVNLARSPCGSPRRRRALRRSGSRDHHNRRRRRFRSPPGHRGPIDRRSSN